MTFPLPIVQGGTTVFSGGATVITLSSNTTDYNLANDLTNNYSWDGSTAINVTLNIGSGVNIRASVASTPAIAATLVSGSNLTINNSGTIAAHGGAQGGAGASNGAGAAGSDGGNAIELSNLTGIINNLLQREAAAAVEAEAAVVVEPEELEMTKPAHVVVNQILLVITVE